MKMLSSSLHILVMLYLSVSVGAAEPATTVQSTNNNIYFYGAVSESSTLQLKTKLEELDLHLQTIAIHYKIEAPPIHLHIQSYGGSLMHTFYIMDVIKLLKTPVYTYIDGFAASAATLMSVCGKRRFMTESSVMLVHQLSSSASGKFEEIKNEYSNLVEFMEIIKKTYLNYGNISSEHLDALLKQDLWLNSAKSLEYGFVDEIIKSTPPTKAEAST
jgi:ATP-dependent protease ClpP protease subunit